MPWIGSAAPALGCARAPRLLHFTEQQGNTHVRFPQQTACAVAPPALLKLLLHVCRTQGVRRTVKRPSRNVVYCLRLEAKACTVRAVGGWWLEVGSLLSGLR